MEGRAVEHRTDGRDASVRIGADIDRMVPLHR